MLVSQPGHHPPRGVTLLARCIQILVQHRSITGLTASNRTGKRCGFPCFMGDVGDIINA
jgi:hypothetical protein